VLFILVILCTISAGHENIRGQEFEEGCLRQRWMGKVSKEGQGPPKAVQPMMMMVMMMISADRIPKIAVVIVDQQKSFSFEV